MDGYRELASAVLIQLAKDLTSSRLGQEISKSAEHDLLSGGCEPYLQILGLDLTPLQFLKMSKKANKTSLIENSRVTKKKKCIM